MGKVQAKLWTVRIFRARNWHNRVSGQCGQRDDTSDVFDVSVSLGAIPEEVDRGFRSIRPTLILQGGRTPKDGDWTEDYFKEEVDNELYLTIRVAKSIEIDEDSGDIPALAHFWFNLSQGQDHRQRFDVESGKLLDALTGLAFSQLGVEYMHSCITPPSPVFIETSERPAQPLLREQALEVRPISFRPFEEIPRSALSGMFPLDQHRLRSMEGPGRWIARSMEESDDFKRFMWSFSGLEVLCGKILPLARPVVGQSLRWLDVEGASTEQALSELLWPTARDDGDRVREPWRNLTFKFSLMALTLTPSEADNDVRQFKELQTFRNQIHGGLGRTEDVAALAKSAFDLFMRYSELATRKLSPS